jgi:hypothetical protein
MSGVVQQDKISQLVKVEMLKSQKRRRILEVVNQQILENR